MILNHFAPVKMSPTRGTEAGDFKVITVLQGVVLVETMNVTFLQIVSSYKLTYAKYP